MLTTGMRGGERGLRLQHPGILWGFPRQIPGEPKVFRPLHHSRNTSWHLVGYQASGPFGELCPQASNGGWQRFWADGRLRWVEGQTLAVDVDASLRVDRQRHVETSLEQTPEVIDSRN
jgi:hypothetical protein